MFVRVVVCGKRFEVVVSLRCEPKKLSFYSISKNSCSTTRRSHRKSTCSTCAIRSSLCRLAGLTNRAYAMQKSFCVSCLRFQHIYSTFLSFDECKNSGCEKLSTCMKRRATNGPGPNTKTYPLVRIFDQNSIDLSLFSSKKEVYASQPTKSPTDLKIILHGHRSCGLVV